MRDGGVPGRHVGGQSLKPLSHQVEVVHQVGGLGQGAVAGYGAGRQVAVGDGAGGAGQGGERQNDASGQLQSGEGGADQGQDCG